MRQPLKPCGTPAAYKRHKARGETVDDACAKANRDHATQKRRAQGAKPRQNDDTQHLIEEIVFLLNCGEGEHAILKATNKHPDNLKRILQRKKRNELIPRIFQPWDLAA